MPDDGSTVRVGLSFIALLNAASREVSALFEQHLDHPTITARQAMCMLTLDANPPISQTELSALLHMDRSSLSVMLRRMEKTKIVSRSLGDDERVHLVSLTRSGRAYMPRVREAEQRTLRQIGDTKLLTASLRQLMSSKEKA